METPASIKLMETANKVLVQSQELVAELFQKTQECERYKCLIKSYEQNQLRLLQQIEMLNILKDKEAA
jgi:hypothetical protein